MRYRVDSSGLLYKRLRKEWRPASCSSIEENFCYDTCPHFRGPKDAGFGDEKGKKHTLRICQGTVLVGHFTDEREGDND